LEAGGMRQFDRRSFFGLGACGLAGCANEDPYFGNTNPPSTQHLICAALDAGDSLDPAKAAMPGRLVPLFEGLTNYHPQTMEPAAGIATHYETSPDGLRVTLYLRGHPDPAGISFPNTNSLPAGLTRGRPAPPDRTPIRWSDGSIITAYDVVYSWRRLLDPATAAPFAHLLYCVQNAREVNAGQLMPERIGVRALDDFTLQTDLCTPTAYFLRLLSCPALSPVPRQTIEFAGQHQSDWTAPGRIVTSGPFLLSQFRARDCMVLSRNPHYVEAGLVTLETVSYLLTATDTSCVNLYKSGYAHLTAGVPLPPHLSTALQRNRDLHMSPSFGVVFPCFNTRKPPFDNVLLRYAVNMAIDKKAIADVFGFRRAVARTLVPPLRGYRPPESLVIDVDGQSYDVLKHDPPGARALLARAGYPGGLDASGRRLRFDLLGPGTADVRLRCEILQQQLRSTLNIQAHIATQEFQAFLERIFSGNYRGMTDYLDWGLYLDANWFLSQFVSGSSVNATGWSDPNYEDMLAKANSTMDDAARMQALGDCEKYLLEAMPFIPLYYDAWAYPQKPYVRGMSPNPMDVPLLKYAWIDTHWRPS
jgi:oligopeptide transport system substrate-binding protein